MKLIEKVKEVNYFGIKFIIPEYIKYIATDEDEIVYGHYDEPDMITKEESLIGSGEWQNPVYTLQLGNVELEGMDWKDTLVKV